MTYLENKPITSSLEQVPELDLSALLRVEQSQHDQVHTTHDNLVPRVLLTGLEEAVVVDDDASAGLKSGNQVLEKLDGVGGRVIVHDPAEKVDYNSVLVTWTLQGEGMILTIGILGNLLLEEIMSHQLNSASDLLVLADWLGSTLHRLGCILHHELHVLVLLGQVHADETVRATHVNKCATLSIDLTKVVAAALDVEQVRDLVALATGKADHSLTHATRTRRVLAESDEHGLLIDSVERKLEAGTGE